MNPQHAELLERMESTAKAGIPDFTNSDLLDEAAQAIRDLLNPWVSAEDEDPPEDGTKILCCIEGDNYAPFTASCRTYHPNAKGKKCWRDPSGVKVYFTHWKQLPPAPENNDECEVISFSSRVCERGTRSCVVHHDRSEETE